MSMGGVGQEIVVGRDQEVDQNLFVIIRFPFNPLMHAIPLCHLLRHKTTFLFYRLF
jgi:hypothetical protein